MSGVGVGVEQWTGGSEDHDVAPPDGDAWDLLVIGGGTAGIVAATTAAGFGADVVLVERDRTGGDCLWTGCVPSKALLAAAHAAADARAAARLGVRVDGIRVDFAAVMAHARAAIRAIEPEDSPAALRAAGVRVVRGTARLSGTDPSTGTATVNGQTIRFRQALLATGSEPAVPDIPGLAAGGPLTSDTVWQLDHLPGRLFVLGGGSIGCELGQAFARLGSEVTIAETAASLLPDEDPKAVALLAAALARDGVTVHTAASVTAVERGPDGSFVITTTTKTTGETTGATTRATSMTTTVDAVLVAAGRRPRTDDLGLDEAGVAIDERGRVRTDRRLRTTNPRVWAAGDLTTHPRFTHTAGVHASIAASNAVLGLRRKVDTVVPRVTFTQPEIASFGTSPRQALAAGLTVRDIPHDEIDRAVADGRTAGISRLVLDGKGRVIGGCIVGPRAGETLAELVLAARNGLRARDLAAAMHAYPTYGYGVWDAAIAEVRANLAKPLTSSATRALLSLRRRWISHRAAS